MILQRVESSSKRYRGLSRESERSLMKTRKRTGPRMLLEELQPGQEEGMKELHLRPHVDCDRRGSLRAMTGDGLGYHRKRVL